MTAFISKYGLTVTGSVARCIVTVNCFGWQVQRSYDCCYCARYSLSVAVKTVSVRYSLTMTALTPHWTLQVLRVACPVVLVECQTWVELLVAQVERAQRLRRLIKSSIGSAGKIICSCSGPILCFERLRI